MSQNPTKPRYQFYRNLSESVPSLDVLFQKLDQSQDDPRLHFELGEAAYQARLLPLSVACFSTVTQLSPRVEAGFFNLGNALFDLRRFGSAARAYEKAFQLVPDIGTLNNLGNTYASMEKWTLAIETFQRALELPNSSPTQMHRIRTNMGKALIVTKDWNAAIENYRQALVSFPKDIPFLASKAYCHQQLSEFGQAINSLVEALTVAPNDPELLCQIADVNFCRGRVYESLVCMNQAFSIRSPLLSLQSRRIQMLAFLASATPGQLLAETRRWASALTPPMEKENSLARPPTGESRGAPPSEPLRAGMVCHALPERGLGDWLPECLMNFPKDKGRWTIYCDSPVPPHCASKLQLAGCELEITSHLSDRNLSQLIRSQRIELLIDTIGHGLTSRLPVFAQRSAPIQVSWGAFPVTSGLDEMDFIWSDLTAIPVSDEPFFSERVLRFPASCFCFQPNLWDPLTLPSHASAPRFRCGFLGRPEQLSETWFDTVQIILSRLPEAEMVFIGQAYRDPSLQTEIRKKLDIPLGPSSPIVFESYPSEEDELNSYQRLDVTLDGFLVHSPQRTFESLWMGVPVVTLWNERLTARATPSILNSLPSRKGIGIATSPSDYAETVERFYRSREERRSDRETLRNELLASSLCDMELMSRAIEGLIESSIRQPSTAWRPKQK